MRVNRHVTALLLVTVLACAAVSAQESSSEVTPELTLETVAEMAIETSTKIQLLERTLADEVDALDWWEQQKDGLLLSLSGKVSGGFDDEGVSWQGDSSLGASVEVGPLPQVTIGAGLSLEYDDDETSFEDGDLSATLNIAIDPLADIYEDERDELAVEEAKLAIETATGEVAYSAISAFVDVIAAAADADLIAEQVVIAREQLATVQALFERDRASDEELESAEDDLRSLLQEVARAEVSLEIALEQLSQMLGVSVVAQQIPAWESLETDFYLEQVLAERNSLDNDSLIAQAGDVKSALLAVEEEQIAVSSTRRFTPELGISATVGYGSLLESAIPQWSVGADLSVSAADWDGTARADAEQDLAIAKTEYEFATRIKALELESALLEFDLGMDDVEAAAHDLEIEEQELSEIEFRRDKGDVTDLAVQEARLAVSKAQQEVCAAEMTAIKLWLTVDLLQF